MPPMRPLGALEEGGVEFDNTIFYLRFKKRNAKKFLGGFFLIEGNFSFFFKFSWYFFWGVRGFNFFLRAISLRVGDFFLLQNSYNPSKDP